MKQLRPYQIDAINATVESINNGMFHNIIALPTGTGKSLVIAVMKINLQSYRYTVLY